MPRRPGELARIALFAGGLQSCAGANPAPEEWRRSMDEAQVSPLGAFSTATLRTEVSVSGELIAVDADAIYLGTPRRLIRLPQRCVKQLRVAAYDGDPGRAGLVGVLGTLSTVTHGFFLIVTLPMWLAATTITTAGQVRVGHETYTTDRPPWLDEAVVWARFPQGMPKGFVGRVAERETLDVACEPLRFPPEGSP